MRTNATKQPAKQQTYLQTPFEHPRNPHRLLLHLPLLPLVEVLTEVSRQTDAGVEWVVARQTSEWPPSEYQLWCVGMSPDFDNGTRLGEWLKAVKCSSSFR